MIDGVSDDVTGSFRGGRLRHYPGKLPPTIVAVKRLKAKGALDRLMIAVY